MQTTYEEYKEWTEDGSVESGTQIVYDKAKRESWETHGIWRWIGKK